MNYRDWWTQLRKKKTPPDLVAALKWVWGAVSFLGLGLVSAKLIDHFSNVPMSGKYAVHIGIATAAYCMCRAFKCAWNARSAFCVFLLLSFNILILIAFTLKLPRVFIPLAERLDELLPIAPFNRARPAVSPYVHLLLYGIAVPIAAIFALAAARYWRRAEIASGICVHKGPQKEERSTD